MTSANIAAPLKEMAQRVPEQLAVLFPQSRDRAGATVYAEFTYRALDEQSDLAAAGLAAIGIGRGVKAVLMVPPSLEFFTLTFALFKAGAIPVFVDPGMGLRNLGKCLAEAEPAAFIGIPKAQLARRLFGWGRSSIRQIVTVGRRLGWGGDTLRGVMRRGQTRADAPGHWPMAHADADDQAAILFTSGSTGVPKGAVYTHGNFNAQIDQLRRVFEIQPGEVDLCSFPLFALFAPALGMTAIVPRMDFTRPARVDPREIEEPIRRFGINNLFGSPALLNRVSRALVPTSPSVKEPSSGNAKSSVAVWGTVKRVLSAGAPVAPAILERFTQLLPPTAQIFTPYGATESLPVAVIGSREVLQETRYQTARGAGTCVGRPVPGIRVEIITITDTPIAEWNDDLRVAPGTIGEIVVDGPMVTQEYYRRPDLTALAKIRDPSTGRMRHRMGDVGYFDADGKLWFCGRKSHRVVSPARTHFTDPVEGVFNQHPAVFRTALVGVKRQGQTEPVLCVEREQTPELQRLSDAELIEELLALGEQFECSRPIRTILFHPAFPVDIRHNSKISRETLAVLAAKKLRSASR